MKYHHAHLQYQLALFFIILFHSILSCQNGMPLCSFTMSTCSNMCYFVRYHTVLFTNYIYLLNWNTIMLINNISLFDSVLFCSILYCLVKMECHNVHQLVKNVRYHIVLFIDHINLLKWNATLFINLINLFYSVLFCSILNCFVHWTC